MSVSLDRNTRRWWTLLRGVSVLNVALWAWVAWSVDLSRPYVSAHLALSAVYTLVCGFRSFYPRVDLERLVLVDHWLSSMVLGRSAATIAEMAFTAQLTLLLFELSPQLSWLYPLGVASFVVIAVAQVTCWLGVLTGNHLWHAAEESLWGLMVAGMAAAGVGLWPEAGSALRGVIALGWVGCAGAIGVMWGLDVPMYLRRWREHGAGGARGVREGFVDALHRREPSGAWSVWRHEIWWMTPYFSFGVWLSLALAGLRPPLS